MWVGGQRHDPAALPPGKLPGTHCVGGWVGPRAVWTGEENVAPTGSRFPDVPTRSKSLYRLSYPGPQNRETQWNKCRSYVWPWIPWSYFSVSEDARQHVSVFLQFLFANTPNSFKNWTSRYTNSWNVSVFIYLAVECFSHYDTACRLSEGFFFL